MSGMTKISSDHITFHMFLLLVLHTQTPRNSVCVRLIDVQMDSVRYTCVFGHPIYEPATSNQHLFSPKFPLFILALSACLLVISIRRKNFKIFSQKRLGNAHILLLQNSAASCRVNSYFFFVTSILS